MEEERPVSEDDADKRNDDVKRLRPNGNGAQRQIDRRKADRSVTENLVEDVQRLTINLSEGDR